MSIYHGSTFIAGNPPAATSSTAGTMKLYTSTGTNTDGTMTQNAITSLIGDIEEALETIRGV